jgi:hypothetical protein
MVSPAVICQEPCFVYLEGVGAALGLNKDKREAGDRMQQVHKDGALIIRVHILHVLCDQLGGGAHATHLSHQQQAQPRPSVSVSVTVICYQGYLLRYATKAVYVTHTHSIRNRRSRAGNQLQGTTRRARELLRNGDRWIGGGVRLALSTHVIWEHEHTVDAWAIKERQRRFPSCWFIIRA